MAKAKSKRSFEEMLGELEETIEVLERGDLPLEEMLARYAAGLELVHGCDDKLRDAERQLHVDEEAQA